MFLAPRSHQRRWSLIRKLTRDWPYDVVAMGYPGPVLHNRPVAEPHNLGPGWAGFNFSSAFKCPIRIVNDAAMQALGGYRRGKMLFLGLGTGLGSALIVDGIVEPMELGHLQYKKATFEDYVGLRGLERFGKKKWRRYVADVVQRLIAAIEPDDVVLGGGNVPQIEGTAAKMPGRRQRKRLSRRVSTLGKRAHTRDGEGGRKRYAPLRSRGARIHATGPTHSRFLKARKCSQSSTNNLIRRIGKRKTHDE